MSRAFFPTRDAATLSCVGRHARNKLHPILHEKAHREPRQLLANLKVGFSQSSSQVNPKQRDKELARLTSEMRALKPKLLREDCVSLDRLESEARSAQVESNRGRFLEALQRHGCQVPADRAVPATESEQQANIDGVLPRRLGLQGELCLLPSGGDVLLTRLQDRTAERFTMDRESLDHFATLLGSSTANVVDWMAALNDPDQVIKVFAASWQAELPISYAYRLDSF